MYADEERPASAAKRPIYVRGCAAPPDVGSSRSHAASAAVTSLNPKIRAIRG